MNERFTYIGWIRALCKVQYFVLLLLYFLLGIAYQPQNVVGDYNDVLMHFIGYVVAGVSVCIAYPKLAIWLCFLQLFVFSTGVEIVQYTLPWRSFDVKDIAANTLGIVLGLICWQIASKVVDSVREK